MGSFSIVHWGILLVVIVLVFGTTKLRNAGKDLGGAVKGFKDAVKDEESVHDKAHDSKHRVLDHEKSPSPTEGTRVDEVKVTDASIDEQRKS